MRVCMYKLHVYIYMQYTYIYIQLHMQIDVYVHVSVCACVCVCATEELPTYLRRCANQKSAYSKFALNIFGTQALVTLRKTQTCMQCTSSF